MKGRRFGSDREPEEIDLSNLMSLYNAVKEDEKERDEKIEKLDISYKFLDVCIRMMREKPKIAKKIIRLPELIGIIMFIAKTQHAINDEVVKSFMSMIREFFDDENTYLPLLKIQYLDFLENVITRVDQDSKTRGEFLAIFKSIGKKAGGVYTEVANDLKSYARAKLSDNISQEDEEKDELEDSEKTVENIKEDIFEQMDNLDED